jgi:hypothetical protein
MRQSVSHTHAHALTPQTVEAETDLVQRVTQPFLVPAEVVRVESVEAVDAKAHDLVVVMVPTLHVRACVRVGLVAVAPVVGVVIERRVLRPVHPQARPALEHGRCIIHHHHHDIIDSNELAHTPATAHARVSEQRGHCEGAASYRTAGRRRRSPACARSWQRTATSARWVAAAHKPLALYFSPQLWNKYI